MTVSKILYLRGKLPSCHIYSSESSIECSSPFATYYTPQRLGISSSLLFLSKQESSEFRKGERTQAPLDIVDKMF